MNDENVEDIRWVGWVSGWVDYQNDTIKYKLKLGWDPE